MRVFSCCQQIGHSLFPPQSLYFYCYCFCCKCFSSVYESGNPFSDVATGPAPCSLSASPFDPQKVSRSKRGFMAGIQFERGRVLWSTFFAGADPLQVLISPLSPSLRPDSDGQPRRGPETAPGITRSLCCRSHPDSRFGICCCIKQTE